MRSWQVFVIGGAIVLGSFNSADAQVPERINYQGRLVDGTNLVNGPVNLVLQIHTTAVGGIPVYEDSNTVVVVDGLYSTFIGDNPTVGSGALSDALVSSNLYLQATVDGTELSPREQIVSSAFALKAGGVPDEAISAAMIEGDAVTSAHVLDDSLDFADFADGMTLDGSTLISFGTRFLALNLDGSGDFLIQDSGGVFAEFQDDGDVAFDLHTLFVDRSTDRVGVGLSDPGEKLTVAGNVAPSANDAHDLGSDALRWRTLYLASQIDYSSELDFASGGATRMTLQADGDLVVTGTVGAAAFSGNGSALVLVDADTLDGQDSTSFAAVAHAHDHGLLTGLGGDDHPQYLRSDAADVYNPNGVNIDLRFAGMADTNMLFLDVSSGRVGIGDASPDGKLEVRQAGAGDILNLYDDSTNVLTVLDGGNVGIGTSFAASKLAVRQDGTNDILQLIGDGLVRIKVLNDGTLSVGQSAPSAKVHITQPGAETAFRVDDESFDGSPFVVSADGDVGIGALTPTHDLTIIEAESGSAGIKLQNNVGDDAVILFHTDGSSQFTVGVDSSDDNNFVVCDGAVVHSSFARLTIRADTGDVGIKRTPTANALEVAGDASKSVAGDWLANSDSRIKRDIAELEDGLAVVRGLRPVKFRYTPDYLESHPEIEDRVYYNFIAQEFAETFPNCVRDDGTGLLQVDAYPVRPYLVAAVQSLSQENDALRTSHAELQSRVAALETCLRELLDTPSGSARPSAQK